MVHAIWMSSSSSSCKLSLHLPAASAISHSPAGSWHPPSSIRHLPDGSVSASVHHLPLPSVSSHPPCKSTTQGTCHLDAILQLQRSWHSPSVRCQQLEAAGGQKLGAAS